MLPKGLICPLLIPFKANGQIDAVGLRQLWEYVNPFVAGISVGSSFSIEGIFLSYEDKKALFKLILGLWEGNKPLYFDITTSDEASMFELAQFSADLLRSQFDELVIEVLPLWYRGNRGLPQSLEALHTQTGAVFLLANHPRLVKTKKRAFKHCNIRTAVFKKIARYDFIKGMIFQGELNRFFNYQRALGGRKNFYFYEADEISFLKQPTNDGVVALTANLVPKMWHKLTTKVLNLNEGKKEELNETFILGEALKELCVICQHRPAILKWALREMGILSEIFTPFSGIVTESDLNALKSWLQKYK